MPPTSKSTKSETGAYHHGDLPNALKAAAAEVIVERGPAGFSLREVARRAGVSHAAPAHHFGDTTGLLTALAIEAFELLDRAMSEAAVEASDPADRLARIGQAYVEVGVTNPAHMAVVFRPDLIDTDSEDYLVWGERAYGHLVAALEAVSEAFNPDLDIDAAAQLCWSMVQGLVVLYDGIVAREDLHQGSPAPIGPMAAGFCDLVMSGLRNAGRPS